MGFPPLPIFESLQRYCARVTVVSVFHRSSTNESPQSTPPTHLLSPHDPNRWQSFHNSENTLPTVCLTEVPNFSSASCSWSFRFLLRPCNTRFLFATSWQLSLFLRHARACSPCPEGRRPVISSIQISGQPCCGRSRITWQVDALTSARDKVVASVHQGSCCGRSPTHVSATQDEIKGTHRAECTNTTEMQWSADVTDRRLEKNNCEDT